MNRQKEWNSILEVFNAMNSCGRYVVLRNFEEISEEKYYMSSHADIDCLCENAMLVRKTLDVRGNRFGAGRNHVFVLIKGKMVKFGIFTVGDGYYDRLWEAKMLDFRVFNQKGFYTLNELSDEYRSRLTIMGNKLGVHLYGDKSLYDCLFQYLENNHYIVEYPLEPNVGINYKQVPPHMLGKKNGWGLRRIRLFVDRVLGKLFGLHYRGV